MNAIYFIAAILFASSTSMFIYISWLNYKATSRTGKKQKNSELLRIQSFN